MSLTTTPTQGNTVTKQRNSTGTDAAAALAALGKKKATPANNLKGAEVSSPVTKWVHARLSKATAAKPVVAAKLPKAVVDHVNKAKVNKATGFSPSKKFRNDSDSAVRAWVKANKSVARVTTNVVVDNTGKVTNDDAVAYTVHFHKAK